LNKAVDDKFRRNSINFLSHIPLSHIPLSDIPKDQDHTKPFENIKYFAHKQQVENLIKRVLKNIAPLPVYLIANLCEYY